jgi:phosphoribosylanthranilate isomerase
MSRMDPGGAMAVLLDRADPAAFGGTGEALDWSVAAAIASALPVWLAGGLTPENVAQAIATVHPWAVDVSSGVESGKGIKDAAKIAAFIAEVRNADA